MISWEWSKRGSSEARTELAFTNEVSKSVATLSRYGLEVWKFGIFTKGKNFPKMQGLKAKESEVAKQLRNFAFYASVIVWVQLGSGHSVTEPWSWSLGKASVGGAACNYM